MRVLGIDDSPFSFDEKDVVIIGAAVRLPNYLEGVLQTSSEVDGTDATDRIAEMVRRSRYMENLAAVLIDGIAVGGFNVIDIEALHDVIRIPVVTVTRDKPDIASIKEALKAKFSDWEGRLGLITRKELHKIETKHKPLYVQFTGTKIEEVEELISKSTVLGALPEPIRIAHLIAAGMRTGESHGRA